MTTQYSVDQYLIDKNALDVELNELCKETSFMCLSYLRSLESKYRFSIMLGLQKPALNLENETQRITEIFGPEKVERVKTYLIKMDQFQLNLRTMDPTFKPLYNRSNFNKIGTYCANWKFIQTFKDSKVKEMTLNFLNSKLYRGEQFFLWKEEDALTLVTMRQCSEEAQNILNAADEMEKQNESAK